MLEMDVYKSKSILQFKIFGNFARMYDIKITIKGGKCLEIESNGSIVSRRNPPHP